MDKSSFYGVKNRMKYEFKEGQFALVYPTSQKIYI
jgi:hypothetical protein